MIKAAIFNIQRFSIHDGPGIRSTVFFKGCPLRCHWCSNPESQKLSPEVSHRSLLCIGNECSKCTAVCEFNAISVAPKKVSIKRSLCNNCGRCVEVCVYNALTVMGKLMTVEEVIQEVLRDVDFYRNSGGGVTASGGEPLRQGEFAAALFKSCQQAGLHTTLDTCGDASLETLRQVLQYTNLVLFDIKLMDARLHQRFTGRSNKQIIRNAQEVDALGVPMIIRVPLIPSINCFEQNIHDIVQFVKGFKHQTPVDLLAYHRMGLSKYDSLDRPYKLKQEEVPADEFVQEIQSIFLDSGVECRICY